MTILLSFTHTRVLPNPQKSLSFLENKSHAQGTPKNVLKNVLLSLFLNGYRFGEMYISYNINIIFV